MAEKKSQKSSKLEKMHFLKTQFEPFFFVSGEKKIWELERDDHQQQSGVCQKQIRKKLKKWLKRKERETAREEKIHERKELVHEKKEHSERKRGNRERGEDGNKETKARNS